MWELKIKDGYFEITLNYKSIHDASYMIADIQKHCDSEIEYVIRRKEKNDECTGKTVENTDGSNCSEESI